MSPVRLVPQVRQLAGTPHVFRSYVFDRLIGRAIMSCPHKHRREWRAKTCAEHMARIERMEASR